MAFQGTLETFYLSSLLQLLCNDKKTGVLRVNDGNDLITVTIKDGTIIHASSTMQKEQLGALLRSQGIISNDELAGFLQTARKKHQKLGKVIVDAGRLQPEELQRFIRLQVEHILYTLFLWQKGTFEYDDCAVNLDSDIVTELDIMEVVLEASRRVDELSVLMRQVPEATQVVRLSEHAPVKSREKLHTDEKAVLELIDGERTIKQIIEESGYDAFTVYKVLYALISSGFVQSEHQAEQDIVVHLERQAPRPPEQSPEPFFSLVPEPSSVPAPAFEPQAPAGPLPGAEPAASHAAGAPAAVTATDHRNEPQTEQDRLNLEPPAKKGAKKIHIGPLPKIPAPEAAAPLSAPAQAAPSEKKSVRSPRLFVVTAAALVALVVVAASLYFVRPPFFSKTGVSTPSAPPEPEPAAPAHSRETPPPADTARQQPLTPEQPPQEKSPDAASFEMASYQDPNAFFFVSLPSGYTVQDTSTRKTTDVLIVYPPNIRVKISARRQTGPWHAETEMYNTIASLQQPHDGFAAARIDTYRLLELGGGKGYEIAASAYQGSLFCKLQVYCLAGYQKTVFIEASCKNCRNPRIDKFFTRIRESIMRTFLLYP